MPTPALSPHQHKSATACAILFSHISSASADLQLTKDPAPVPSTSFMLTIQPSQVLATVPGSTVLKNWS